MTLEGSPRREAERPLGARLPYLRTEPPGPASRALAERLRQVESRNVTYLADGGPIFWEEAVGSNVRDADGNVYIDLTGAFGVALLGHASALTLEAISDQSARLIHGMGDIHPPTKKLDLLERLADLAPWPDARIVLSSTGSEACETALKTALLATGRAGVLAFQGGYHGLTVGSLAVTERAHFRKPFAERVYGGVAFAPFPDRVGSSGSDAASALDAVRALLSEGAPNGHPIGAVIVEPVQARGGARIPPEGFMDDLSRLAREAGALVIADEIMTGLGRCGAPLASPLVGLVPDLICLGKALGGGLPLSACMGSAEVMDSWPESDGEAIHTSTFLGHPLACAVGSDFLDLLCDEGVCERARTDGRRLREALALRLQGVQGVVEVRGLGLLLGIEFEDRAGGLGVRVAEALLRRGVIALPAGEGGHVLEFTPPVGLTEEQVAFVAAAVGEAIEEVL